MTAEQDMSEEPAAAGEESEDAPLPEPGSDGLLQPVEPSYVHVLRIRTLLAWLPLLIGSVVLGMVALEDHPAGPWLMVAVPILAAINTGFAPKRIWARLGYALEPAMLRVVRGWLWHVDTLVPLVRVQHLDIARGLLDKMFGTASLIVHTAGTHNSTVKLSGLSPERAAALAAIIRTHIQADLD